MASGLNAALLPLAPLSAAPSESTGEAGAHASRQVQRVTAASNTSAANATALAVGAFATIRFATDARVRFGNSTPTAVATDVLFLQGQQYDWEVTESTKFVAIINATATVEAHVWCSSPAQA